MYKNKVSIAIAILILGAIAVSAFAAVKAKDKPKPKAAATKKTIKPVAKPLPKLLELGSTTCVPCKMMAPILKELTKEYKGRLQVQFIDVVRKESYVKKYKISVIPTQIFFDSKGKEIYRHTGYFPKKDILKVFKDKKIDLSAPKPTAPKKPVKAAGA